MKRIITIICLCFLQIASAQIKPKFHTIDREMGLNSTGEYRNAISLGFSVGQTMYRGDLDIDYVNANNNNIYSLQASKRISKRISLQLRASYGHLSGTQAIANSEVFTSDFQSYSFIARKNLRLALKKAKEGQKESKFKAYAGLGAGYHISDVHLFPAVNINGGTKKRMTAPFLMGTFECNLFLSDYFGIMAGVDYNQFFTDNVDLKITFADWDAFLNTRFGICVKFE